MKLSQSSATDLQVKALTALAEKAPDAVRFAAWLAVGQGALRGSNLLFRIEGEGLSVAHIGDLGHMPNEAQLAALQGLDVLMLPIGGTYTITTEQAEELISALRPRVAVAMHFRTDDYEINISTPDQFIADTQAVRMPREIEITKENIGTLPPVIIMNHKD